MKNNMRKKVWFEYCPGCAFPAVSLKKKRFWFLGVFHLVIYRNDVYEPSVCNRQWMPEDVLFDRNEKTGYGRNG
jgi:hypothetical protein